MRWLSWLKKPWIHFLLLGFLLFELQQQLFPEPKPVVGPLPDARIEALQQQWFSTTGRLPNEVQLARLVESELDRDMLFQRALEYELHLYDTVIYQRLLRNMNFLQMAEGKSDEELYEQALEMRLHLGDEVVKRRLIQVMEQLLLAGNPPATVTEQDLAAEFDQRRDELRLPPRYTIAHIYFSRDREGEIPDVIAAINADNLDPRQARELSSPFLPGYEFASLSPDQLARHFGAAFVKNLEEAGPAAGHWLGPIRSTYGMHYVWVEAVEPARDATLEEVRQRLVRDLDSRARATALREAIVALRQQFEVRS